MQLLYSETILSFLKRAFYEAKNIVQHEMKIPMGKSRLIYKQYSYPLNLVIFEQPGILGYFHSELYEIGIHKSFIYNKNHELLRNLLRHELAHYICYLEYGNSVSSHGAKYRLICEKYGWKKEVYQASQASTSSEDYSSNHILKKVKKLLHLADQSNPFESASALAKANTLLKKYHLTMPLQECEEWVLKRVILDSSLSGKIDAICQILPHFFIKPMLHKGKKVRFLELFGKKEDIEIGEYVAYFLQQELERLWKQAQNKQKNLKGIRAKNSFFRGIAQGFMNQLQTKQQSAALIQVQHQLTQAFQTLLPHARSITTYVQSDEKSQKYGIQIGNKLKIAKGLQKQASPCLLSINSL